MRNAICLYVLIGLTLPVTIQAQFVGIGTNTPTGPLSFSNAVGNKLVLWGDGASTHYGIGIQGGLLQVYANQPTDAIAFGTGRSDAFAERARIYRSADGLEGMTLRGRLHLQNGNTANSGGGGGIWLYNPANTALIGFTGTENAKNIGFFGIGSGWGFTYETTTGRVGIGNTNPNAPLSFAPSLGKKITLYPGTLGDAGFGMAGNRLQIYSDNPNADVAIGYDAAGVFNERMAIKPNGAIAVMGNTGSAGQVLTSAGSGGAASWTTPAGGYLFQSVQTSNSASISSGSTDIPGLTANFTITSPSRVLFQYRVRVSNTSCFGCGDRRAFVSLYQNVVGGTTSIATTTVYMPNGEFAEAVSGPITVDLQPGTYSYKLVLEGSVFGTQPILASTAGMPRLTWQIFPQ